MPTKIWDSTSNNEIIVRSMGEKKIGQTPCSNYSVAIHVAIYICFFVAGSSDTMKESTSANTNNPAVGYILTCFFAAVFERCRRRFGISGIGSSSSVAADLRLRGTKPDCFGRAAGVVESTDCRLEEESDWVSLTLPDTIDTTYNISHRIGDIDCVVGAKTF